MRCWRKCSTDCVKITRQIIEDAPGIDAVELPKGRPGDCLEWDNGTGYRQIYAIHSVMICDDCMRYELAHFAPVVNHKGIVRIMSREEAERIAKERREKEKYVSGEAVSLMLADIDEIIDGTEV